MRQQVHRRSGDDCGDSGGNILEAAQLGGQRDDGVGRVILALDVRERHHLHDARVERDLGRAVGDDEPRGSARGGANLVSNLADHLGHGKHRVTADHLLAEVVEVGEVNLRVEADRVRRALRVGAQLVHVVFHGQGDVVQRRVHRLAPLGGPPDEPTVRLRRAVRLAEELERHLHAVEIPADAHVAHGGFEGAELVVRGHAGGVHRLDALTVELLHGDVE